MQTTKCSSVDEWINDMWYIHTMGISFSHETEVLIYITMWMNIMLTERIQSQKAMLYGSILNTQNRQTYRDKK